MNLHPGFNPPEQLMKCGKKRFLHVGKGFETESRKPVNASQTGYLPPLLLLRKTSFVS
ncbi:hypothetical protein GGU45_001570 [Niabella hirudinis]